jgi:hypothetical protein
MSVSVLLNVYKGSAFSSMYVESLVIEPVHNRHRFLYIDKQYNQKTYFKYVNMGIDYINILGVPWNHAIQKSLVPPYLNNTETLIYDNVQDYITRDFAVDFTGRVKF